MHFAIPRTFALLAVSFLCSPTLLAQNDECTGALPLADGLNGPYSNVSATANLADPLFTCGGTTAVQKDLWFTYMPSSSGATVIETCSNAGFDTRIAIYTGTCGALVALTCNDDACSLQSRASFAGIAGATYTVRVAGFNTLSGTFSLMVSTVLPDECATAATVFVGETGPLSNASATSSSEAWSCGTPGNDLWFRFVATCGIPITVSTCNSNFDTVLEVYSGTCAARTLIGCNDDACGVQSSVSFSGVSGRVYFLRVGGASGASGSVSIRVDSPCPPSNDACAAPRTITTGSNGPFDSTYATTGAPQACGTATNDVWYRYTPICGSGTYTIDTCGSSYDTVLGVFTTPNQCEFMTSIACNDDACGLQSSVTVTLAFSSTLFICVGSATGATGLHRVNISTTACAGNDECSAATPITLGRNGPFALGHATTSSPSSGCTLFSGQDIWYRWIAPCDGNAVIGTCGSPASTTIAMHRGSNCSTLSDALCSTLCGSNNGQVAFVAAQGESYWVRVYPVPFGSGALDFFLDVTLTGTVGSFSTISTACGGLTMTASGTPTLGGTLQFTLGGTSGTPYLWFGSLLTLSPFCPPELCALGADMAVVFGGVTSTGLQVPCDLSLVGGSLACQGADLQLSAGSCPLGAPFALAFSDTVVTTIL